MTGRSELDLSVVIPCHNVEGTLDAQLHALSGEPGTGAWEVLIVDNRSSDRTRSIAEHHAQANPRFRIVSANDDASVAYARNSGVRASAARSVAFCDGDDVVHAGWVAAMMNGLESHELVSGAVEAETLNSPHLASSRPGTSDDRLPMFGTIPFARGNNCGMRRELWDRLGGFDEAFVGLEDIEFSLRARAEGVSPYFAADARVAYRYREGVGDVWHQGVFYGRGRPALIRLAGDLDLQGAPDRWEGLRSWGWLVAHLPELRNRVGRLRWTWVLANRIGVLRGALDVKSVHV